MGLGREIFGEYVRHRLYGRHRPRPGYWRSSPFERPMFPIVRPRRRVEVSGCGCCLPIPLGVLTAAGVGLSVRRRSKS